MYELTAKGQEELDRYADATEDDLRLSRRTLMYPVLTAISNGHSIFLTDLAEETGLPFKTTRTALGQLVKQGLIEYTPPGPDSSEDEWIYHKRKIKSWGSMPPGDLRKEYLIAKSRYPEVVLSSDPEYYQKNKEKIQSRQKVHYEKNKDKILVNLKEYRKDHAKELSAQRKDQYQKNKEKFRVKNRTYRQKNREKILAQGRAYYQSKKLKEV